MKIALRCALSAFMLASPLAAAPAFAQMEQHGQSRPDAAALAAAAHGADGRSARQQRQNWRDDRPDASWDDAQHNGYFQGKVWRRGPPPAARAGQSAVTLGYEPWKRGQRLGYYKSRYEVVDYRSLNRRHPRRGYHWVRDERGDNLLVAIATGVIADIIINNAR
ncbi:MAG: RcnB family protein [Caulobacterales bacterium]